MPVEPQFQNPPQAPNYYPYLSDAEPVPQSSRSLPPAPTPLEFMIRVGDQNLDDTLYVRWVSDYPPYTLGVSKVLVDGPDGMGLPLPPTVPAADVRTVPTYSVPTSPIRCEGFPPGASHSLAVIVSDRPFLPSDQPFSGELRYNRVPNNSMNMPVTFPLMTGWTIEGCQ